MNNPFNVLQDFKVSPGRTGKLCSLPALGKALGVKISRLPVSIRIEILENVERVIHVRTPELEREKAGKTGIL